MLWWRSRTIGHCGLVWLRVNRRSSTFRFPESLDEIRNQFASPRALLCPHLNEHPKDAYAPRELGDPQMFEVKASEAEFRQLHLEYFEIRLAIAIP
jgi:hypothetical protein